MKRNCITVLLLLCALLCGCGAEKPEEPQPVELSCGSYAPDTVEFAGVVTAEDIPLLDGFALLEKADFSGSECVAELAQWAKSHSNVSVDYTVTLPNGKTADNHLKELDLSSAGRKLIAEYLPLLPVLPELEYIDLGSAAEDRDVDFSDVAALQKSCGATVEYHFELYGQEHSTLDTELNFHRMKLEDNGEAVRTALPCMPLCSYVDMDGCGISNEDMAVIRDENPHAKVVWRIWFGTEYSVRTDVETILASSTYKYDQLNPKNSKALMYCTDLVRLDLGHNPDLTDISFCAYMPKLQVLILALDEVEDISPLANCTELEYAELYFTKVKDLTPLANLKNLRHLNIGGNEQLEDITPILGLTGLERLWIGRYDYNVPREQIEQMQAAAPQCKINLTSWDPMDDGWRRTKSGLDPRYEKLREEFRYDDGIDAYSYCFNDPLY